MGGIKAGGTHSGQASRVQVAVLPVHGNNVFACLGTQSVFPGRTRKNATATHDCANGPVWIIQPPLESRTTSIVFTVQSKISRLRCLLAGGEPHWKYPSPSVAGASIGSRSDTVSALILSVTFLIINILLFASTF
ncbi:hypothetical protein CRG98_010063 [Punica granatum]|uniref:Uncharacterized protein n=1 Tax=Punica granatum TaxID=22663 RepID=A0A2I0KM10_PUNGR|nr:hypothetical protein CRG98_010063 [Punica granatum]